MFFSAVVALCFCFCLQEEHFFFPYNSTLSRSALQLTTERSTTILLLQASSCACVGAGDRTVVNLDVRKCWHLLPDDFTIDNQQQWFGTVHMFLISAAP